MYIEKKYKTREACTREDKDYLLYIWILNLTPLSREWETFINKRDYNLFKAAFHLRWFNVCLTISSMNIKMSDVFCKLWMSQRRLLYGMNVSKMSQERHMLTVKSCESSKESSSLTVSASFLLSFSHIYL